MASLYELARSHTRLAGDDLAHLQRLTASWGMLADLCFADLLLMAPMAGEEGHRFVILAQVRPTT
ncbi:MAG: histidine kinase N-terminal domain-containing protein, partial [Acidimicrobiia bacterium]